MLTVKGCSERRFLESGLTKSFTASNFGDRLAMTIIFFYDQLGAANSHSSENDTCHRQSMC